MDATRIHQILARVRAGLGEGAAATHVEQVAEIGEMVIGEIESLLASPRALALAPAEPPIYVVVSADDLNRKWLANALKENPSRQPNPIVWETNVNGATLEAAQKLAAQREREGYAACRVGRIAFDDVDGRPL